MDIRLEKSFTVHPPHGTSPVMAFVAPTAVASSLTELFSRELDRATNGSSTTVSLALKWPRLFHSPPVSGAGECAICLAAGH